MSGEQLLIAFFAGSMLIAFGLLPGAAFRELREVIENAAVRFHMGIEPTRTHWSHEREEAWPPRDRMLFAVVGVGLILLALWGYLSS